MSLPWSSHYTSIVINNNKETLQSLPLCFACPLWSTKNIWITSLCKTTSISMTSDQEEIQNSGGKKCTLLNSEPRLIKVSPPMSFLNNSKHNLWSLRSHMVCLHFWHCWENTKSSLSVPTIPFPWTHNTKSKATQLSLDPKYIFTFLSIQFNPVFHH